MKCDVFQTVLSNVKRFLRYEQHGSLDSHAVFPQRADTSPIYLKVTYMKSLFVLLTGLALILPVMTGCSGEAEPEVPTSAAIIASFKSNLQVVVDTGEGGSGLDVLRSDFEELQKQAPEKAAAVEKDYQSLMKAGKPEDRKTLAAKIIADLE